MKINEEIFLKYLSDLLTENEKKEFEKYLKNNPATQKQFEEVNNRFYSLKSKPEIDERYFNTLVPKVRLQLNKSNTKYFLKLSYVIPILISLIYISYSFFNRTKINKVENTKLNLTLLTDSEELADDFFSDFFMTESISIIDDSLAIIAQEKLEQNFYENEIALISDEIIFENSIFNDYAEYLTEQELNNIFLKLENKNKL